MNGFHFLFLEHTLLMPIYFSSYLTYAPNDAVSISRIFHINSKNIFNLNRSTRKRELTHLFKRQSKTTKKRCTGNC